MKATSQRFSGGVLTETNIEYELSRRMDFSLAKRTRLYTKLMRAAHNDRDPQMTFRAMLKRFRRQGDRRRHIYKLWLDNLEAGQRINEVMAPYIPASERMMIAAGEENGRIADGFREALFVAQTGKQIRGALIKALAYPVLLLLIQAAVLVIASYQLVPVLEGLLSVDRWPPIAQGFHALTSNLRSWGFAWIAAGFAAVTLIFKTLPGSRGNVRAWLDQHLPLFKTLPSSRGRVRAWLDHHLPPWSIYREVQSANFLVAMAALVKEGASVDVAMKSLMRVATPWLAAHLQRMVRGLERGETPGVAIRTGLLDDETAGDLEDYSDGGAFEEAIETIGKDAVEDSITRITAQAWVANILIMFAVAITILWMYGSMILTVLKVRELATAGMY